MHISNPTDKFVLSMTFIIQIILSSLLTKKYEYLTMTGSSFSRIWKAKSVNNLIHGKLIYSYPLQALVLFAVD